MRALLTFCAVLAATPLHAQDGLGSAPTQQVRIVLMNGAQQTGRLASLTPAGVTLQEGNRQKAIPLSDVLRVERVTHHARVLTLVGLGVGFMAGRIIFSGCRGPASCDTSRNGASLFTAGIGTAIGGLSGLAWDRNAPVLYAAPTNVGTPSHPQQNFPAAGVGFSIGW